MQWTVSDLLVSVPVTYAVAGIAATILGIAHFKPSPRLGLDALPTAGSSGWLGSWWDSIKFVINPADIIREGYKKYNGATFKIATLYGWIVVVNKRALVEEMRSARDDELSFKAVADEDFSSEFLIGSQVLKNRYHIPVISSQLTRNIGALCPEIRDEIITAFHELLDLKDHEWKRVPALATIRQVVCRASNRTFVGLPLCRNPDYVALNIRYAVDIMTGGLAVGRAQNLDSLVVRLVTNVPKNTRRALMHIRPIIEERMKYMNEYGKDWTDKPKDLLSWLMDEAGSDGTVDILNGLMLSSNLGAIHTTSNSFTTALYNLAANPQYVQSLREEVEAIVEKDGWSKTSLAKMRKVDSFFKESMRMESTNICLRRKVMKDFMFSDGTLIPKGTRINAGLIALHYDDALYENPEVFDPFRFSDMHEGPGEGVKNQFVTTSPEYLPFGHGRHACPGRFFAANEMKTMLAHILMTYDFKLEENTTRPPSVHIGLMIAANPTAKLMFRKRARQNEEH